MYNYIVLWIYVVNEALKRHNYINSHKNRHLNNHSQIFYVKYSYFVVKNTTTVLLHFFL
jgi:hypothetical protein